MRNSIRLSVLGLCAAVSTVNADDVFNFYFQKAPGPHTVIQGGGGQTAPSTVVKEDGTVIQTPAAPAAAPAAAAPAATTLAAQSSAAPLAASPLKKWELYGAFVGANHLPRSQDMMVTEQSDRRLRNGGVLGFNYNLNQHFAVGASATYFSNGSVGSLKQDRYKYGIQSGERMEYAGVMTFTPFRLNTFGYDLVELGLVAGVSTLHLNREALTDDQMSYGASADFDHVIGVGFLGPKIAVNFDPSFGVFGEIRWDVTSEHKFHQVMAGARIRL